MGLITSLNLSNFSFHSFELAATSSDGLQHWLSALCLRLCCGSDGCREELDERGLSAVVLGMLGVGGGRADGVVRRLVGHGAKAFLVIWVCRRFTTIYLLGEVPFSDQPNLSCTVCYRRAGFAYSMGSFERKEWKVCQNPWITATKAPVEQRSLVLVKELLCPLFDFCGGGLEKESWCAASSALLEHITSKPTSSVFPKGTSGLSRDGNWKMVCLI